MTQNYVLAFQLLIVGMISVFIILGIVVCIGRFLIYIVNKMESQYPDAAIKNPTILSRKNIAVISATVAHITKGRGVVESIKKL